MGVESDTERAVLLSTSDFAQSATNTPSGGSGSSINGIFDNGDGFILVVALVSLLAILSFIVAPAMLAQQPKAML